MPLPLTVSCFSKIQIGFAFLVPAHPGSSGHRAVKRVCVCARAPRVPRARAIMQSLFVGLTQRLLSSIVHWSSAICYQVLPSYLVYICVFEMNWWFDIAVVLTH